MPFLTQVKPLWDHSTLTLAELAEKCNISESSASRYLNGKIIPPADIAERILEVLGADIVTPPTSAEKSQAAVPPVPPVLQIWEVYKDEINDLKQYHAHHVETILTNHANHIAAIKENYTSQIADLKRDKTSLYITMLVMFCLLVYIIFDALHGGWGIIRYVVG
jgi:transcriptional regulator with XRE-family HTH domain